MALIIDLDDLSQGGLTTPTDAVWTVPGTAADVDITSVGTELPDLDASDYFEIRDHSDPENNGLYRVNEANPTTGTISAFKITGPAPVTAALETVRVFGTLADDKNVHFDTDTREMHLLEQALLSGDGATQQAIYSFIKIEWKADPDLIPHPFPMIAITPEQFEYIDGWNPFDSAQFGPDATGITFVDGGGGNDIIRNLSVVEDDWVILGYAVGDAIVVRNANLPANNGFYTILAISGASNEDIEIATGQLSADTADTAATVTGAIRSRKLIRTGGWSEVEETTDKLLRQYSCVLSLGGFEDALDRAYFFQGSDNTDLGAAKDMDFTDSVNEAVLVYQDQGVDAGAGYTFADASPDTIADTDSSFITKGYQVGSQVTVTNATISGNNGTYEITVVAAGLLTVTAIGGGDAGLTASASDTTAELAVDHRNSFDLRLRIRDGDVNGKSFDSSDLVAIGVTGAAGMDNKVFRFPLSNQTDLKISATDADILTTPHSEIEIRYFDQAFNREVDSATNRDFGIVIDVGTHSGVDGSIGAGGVVLTSAEGGIVDDGRYESGTLRIHEQTDENTVFTIDSGAAAITATTVTITGGTFTAAETDVSFTIQRASPVVATLAEIYEKVQFQLRQDADIDATDQVVVGRTADELLTFVGDALRAGELIPTNPQGGGSGVIIEGFDTNDTNDLAFFDNTGVSRAFPFVAAGTITFNLNLQNDTGPAEYFMFFEYTRRVTNSDIDVVGPSGDTYDLEGTLGTYLVNDYIRVAGFAQDANNGIFIVTVVNVSGSDYTVRRVDGQDVGTVETNQTVSVDEHPIDSPGAIIVNDNSGTPIEGTVPGASVAFDVDYVNNVQGGRTGDTDLNIVIRALGEDVAAFVEVFGVITKATGLVFSVVAPLERNFTNPV